MHKRKANLVFTSTIINPPRRHSRTDDDDDEPIIAKRAIRATHLSPEQQHSRKGGSGHVLSIFIITITPNRLNDPRATLEQRAAHHRNQTPNNNNSYLRDLGVLLLLFLHARHRMGSSRRERKRNDHIAKRSPLFSHKISNPYWILHFFILLHGLLRGHRRGGQRLCFLEEI